MWARIEDGKVAELTDVDPKGRFHPDLKWIKCDASVSTGMTYADGKFTMPEDVAE